MNESELSFPTATVAVKLRGAPAVDTETTGRRKDRIYSY